MNIGIVSATHWEVSDFIRHLGMEKTDDCAYDYQNVNLRVLLKISGIGEKNAFRSAEEILSHFQNSDSPLMISTGLAGGLRKEIESGDVVIDTEKSDPEISEKIAEISRKFGITVHKGNFFTSARIIMTREEKAILANKTDAIALEMESRALFQFCKEHKVRFCSFRAVSDTLSQNLPKVVTTLDLHGKAGISFFKTFFAYPNEWTDFFRLIYSSRKARENLSSILLDFVKEERK